MVCPLGLARLNANGSLDFTFNPALNPGGVIFTLGLQPDGKIIMGGGFTNVAGVGRRNLARLNADGSLDNTFAPEPSSSVYLVEIQPNGKVLVGGGFTNIAGQNRKGFARLNNSEAATESLSFDGTSVQWLRGGTSPELARATFDYSADATNWLSLAGPFRIAGGWSVTASSIPTNSFVRSRGYITGGFANGSTWFAESIIHGVTQVTNLVPVHFESITRLGSGDILVEAIKPSPLRDRNLDELVGLAGAYELYYHKLCF